MRASATNLLVRTSSDRCQQTTAPKLLAAATLVAIAALFAPAAYAHSPEDVPNPFCFIQGPGSALCGTNVTFVATSPSLAGQSFNAVWSLLNNNAGASFVGTNTCLATQSCSVVVTTSQGGSVVVRVILDFGGGVLKTCQVTLTVAGGAPPTGTCPPNITVPCPGPIDPSVTGMPIFSGGCGQVTTSFVDTVTGSNCGGPITTRTWTAMNTQGQTATCTQIISRSSTPAIACPAPITVPCFSLVPPPDVSSVTASDGCGGTATVTHVGDVASNGTSNCSNFISRTYRATNACGVTADCTQTITVTDTTPPSISCPGPVTVQCFSLVPAPSTTAVTATDTCGGAVTVMHVGDAASAGTTSCNNVITRTYRATDACGNQATCTQAITVDDTTAPMVNCPGPLAFQCFSQVPAPNIGSVSGSDNCGGLVTVTHVGDSASNGTSSCMNIVTRTYQGVDTCGNVGTCTQTFTINDSTPPSITCPGAVSVQCFSSLPPPNIGSVTGTDNCGGAVTVTHMGDSASNGTSSVNNIVTRTYQAVDSCGNMTTCTQTITVNDTTGPTLTCASALSVQCFALVPVPNIASVTAIDGCGGAVTVTFMGDVASNGTSNCFNVITRTYQGVDLGGNVSVCTQTITVNDTTPPAMITCPAPVTVTCFSQVPPPAPPSIAATDNCGGVVAILHLSDTPSNGSSSCNNVITRTYRATDLCGNQATCTQLITVNDTTPPVLSCPAPMAVQCFSLVPAPNIGLVSGTDNCGGVVTITHLSDVAMSGTSNCMNVITRTYQGVDACGNAGTCTHLITVNDTTPPSITCPGPVTAQCFATVPIPNITLVTATDNCGGAPTVAFVSDVATNGTSSCMNVITRTYRATDACGNMNTCTQMITVNDTTPPTITCPGPLSIDCYFNLPGATPLLLAASDNCGGLVIVTHVSDSTTNGTSSCNNVVTRTYQATDACGNTNTCTQTITVHDTTPPIILCPPPQSFQCFAQIPSPDPSSVSDSDNCGGTTVIHLGDSATNGNSSCNNVITRTYQSTDNCGNTNTCTQTITVNDTTPPSITCPAAVSIQCFSQVPAAVPGLIAASDNCGGVVPVIHVSDVATNGTSSCNNVITRIYLATDACGNTNTCTQTIAVNDTTPPTLTCPTALSFQCFSLVPTPNIASVTATDNCGGAVTVTFVSDVATMGTSSCGNVVTRTYQGVDACGNQSTCTQTFTVSDTTPPVITCPPDFTGVCGSPTDPGTTGTATATDNCNLAPTISFTDVTTGACPTGQLITRTWTASDGCQSVSCNQVITLTPPPPSGAGCTFSVGGSCGSPTPVLTATFQTLTITPMITGATPNFPGVIAAQIAPYSPVTPLATPCLLHLDPLLLPGALDSFLTDASGSWMMAYNIPAYPSPVRALLQAVVGTPTGGPLGTATLSNGLEVWRPCPPCTYSRTDWAAPTGAAAALLDAEWINLFPMGMDIGIFNPANGILPPNGIHWTPDMAGKTSLRSFLNTIIGLPIAIPFDLTNPTGAIVGPPGAFLAVLRLNIRFNESGFLGETNPGFGNMIYTNPGLADPLEGATVNQILAICDQALAGNGLPPGHSFTSLGIILDRLSVSFQNCVPSTWAGQHLRLP